LKSPQPEITAVSKYSLANCNSIVPEFEPAVALDFKPFFEIMSGTDQDYIDSQIIWLISGFTEIEILIVFRLLILRRLIYPFRMKLS